MAIAAIMVAILAARSNRALLYNKPSILQRTVGTVETNVFSDQIDFYRICPSDRHVWESLQNQMKNKLSMYKQQKHSFFHLRASCKEMSRVT
jgi:hypothetical protein